MNCVSRELTFELDKMRAKLHLLMGLGKIILDIDKAIRIIRETKKDSEVIPNLCEGFDIDTDQAEFIADIKLRNLNREYILNKLRETDDLKAEIAKTEEILSSERKLKSHIAKQLKSVKAKYAKPRCTQIIYEDELLEPEEDVSPDDSVVNHIIYTREGYFKKISQRSLKATDTQKLKEGDTIVLEYLLTMNCSFSPTGLRFTKRMSEILIY